MSYNPSLIELFYLKEFQPPDDPFTLDFRNFEKQPTDIDMSPELPDYLFVDVRDCLASLDAHASGLQYFSADHRLSLQCVMGLIHDQRRMDEKIAAMALELAVEADIDSVQIAEAQLLARGLEALAISLVNKLNTYGVYGDGYYLTYQFYDLINGRLALNKIIVSDPNDYTPTSSYVLPSWVAQRTANQNRQFVLA